MDIKIGCNTNEPQVSTRYQPRGVASFITNKLAYKIIGKGVDPTRLGRWCWTKYQGKGGKVLRVITAYRQCQIGGIKSTVVQQLRYLIKKERLIHPRQAFMHDLHSTISIWSEAGESIIVMGDLNENIKSINMR